MPEPLPPRLLALLADIRAVFGAAEAVELVYFGEPDSGYVKEPGHADPRQ